MRRTYAGGMVLIALAPGIGALVTATAVQGAGVAVLLPCPLALLMRQFSLETDQGERDLLELVRQPYDYLALAWYVIEEVRQAHLAYAGSVRWLLYWWCTPDRRALMDESALCGPAWLDYPLDPAYLPYHPELLAVAIDERQRRPL